MPKTSLPKILFLMGQSSKEEREREEKNWNYFNRRGQAQRASLFHRTFISDERERERDTTPLNNVSAFKGGNEMVRWLVNVKYNGFGGHCWAVFGGRFQQWPVCVCVVASCMRTVWNNSRQTCWKQSAKTQPLYIYEGSYRSGGWTVGWFFF